MEAPDGGGHLALLVIKQEISISCWIDMQFN